MGLQKDNMQAETKELREDTKSREIRIIAASELNQLKANHLFILVFKIQ